MSSNFQYPNITRPTTQRSQTASDVGLEATLLYGKTIDSCPVPTHTAAASNKPLAVFNSNRGAFGLSEKLLSKHLLLLGGIGSGKTNTIYFLLKQLLPRITNNDLVLIFDSKGDFYQKFYNPWDPGHIVVGNHEIYATNSYSWSIFDELRNSSGRFDRNSELTAKEIAKLLFTGRESQNQPFFCQAATDLVAKVLIDFIRHRSPRELNNPTLVQYFRSANASLYHEMIDRNPDFESARDYIGKKGANLTPQALGVLSYISTMVNDIFIGIFGESRPSGTFSMRQLVQQKGRKVVFIEYDLNVGEILGPIYSLLYDLALKQALGGRNQVGSTYLICDEFRIIPKLSHINDALNMGRSLGVKVIAGLQTINQLYDVYGEELGKTIAAGFMNSICFQAFDLDTREFISKRFGENYINLSFRSLNTVVSTQREGNVVEDWDIMKLKVGDAFVNLSGEDPFKFHFEEYK